MSKYKVRSKKIRTNLNNENFLFNWNVKFNYLIIFKKCPAFLKRIQRTFLMIAIGTLE